MKPSQKQSFLELLGSVKKFVIPKIQRDYAQGRCDMNGKVFYSEIRGNFLDALEGALVQNRELVLDYIYGSDDETDHFYPVDGQQRLTTLFLLHWYIGVKEHRLDEAVKTELKKFSYETRDTTVEFCAALLSLDLDVEHIFILSDAIKDSHVYHRAYDWDPSVASMLVMLDKIHEKFHDHLGLWDRLHKITFWRLTLENFGLTDDLFVKMNARGKRLSKFDTFKSDLESALEERSKLEAKNGLKSASLDNTIAEWKTNIDNDYLDYFWQHFHRDVVERNLFRVIMFYTKCLNLLRGATYDQSWETNDEEISYRAEINAIVADEMILCGICTLLGHFPKWINLTPLTNELLLAGRWTGANTILYYDKVKLFGLLYWWANVDDKLNATNFEEFFRVLTNYVNGLREYDIYSGQFRSNVAASNFKTHIAFIKQIIDDYAASALDFVSFVLQSNYREMEYEKEKYRSPDFNKIKDLEKVPALGGIINNFFFGKQLYIDANDLQKILADKQLINKYLRIVLSYGAKKYGQGENLLFEETTRQTRRKTALYYDAETDRVTGFFHRCAIHPDTVRSEKNFFGEKFLTAPFTGNTQILVDLATAIRAFAMAFYAKRSTGKSVEDSIEELLLERLQSCDFSDNSNILWYPVKYPNFFFAPTTTFFMVIRRKNPVTGYNIDNPYHLQCFGDLWGKHYNPFYFALSHVLSEIKSPVTINENTLCSYDENLEYAHPCMLSNGWRAQIMKYGEWRITFNGNITSVLTQSGLTISGDEYLLKNNGNDCIELLVDFIQKYGI